MRGCARTVTIAAIAAAAFFPARYSVSESKAQTQAARQCAGRFDFMVPAALKPTGREQSLYLVKVWSEPQPASFPAPKAAGARKFELAGVGEAVWFQPSATYPKELRLVAMKPAAEHALFFEADATAGREANGEKVVSRLAAAFVPASPHGFCVEHGAFVIAASKNERARASFSGGGVELSVQTETVGAPDDGQSTAGGAPGIRTLAKDRRMVAGLNGIEEKVEIADPAKGPRLAYTWIYPGEAGSGLRPRVLLKAGARQDQRAALDAAWAALTGSLQQRTPGVR